MPLTEFSKQVGDALLRAFPQFGAFAHVGPGLEIRFPHPGAATELLITTAGEEISIFLGSDHRHLGMCRHWPIEKQLARAQELISGILSGARTTGQEFEISGPLDR